MTNLDKFEKFSQFFYTGSLALAPAWWLKDNFKVGALVLHVPYQYPPLTPRTTSRW